MRDAETAAIAVQAAMTGHLVFSTLHTNDAVAAVPRLLDLGVPPYLVAATVEGVLAQRLVRCVCPACRAPYEPSAASVARLVAAAGGADEPVVPTGPFTRGAGCPACRGTGYRGRVGVFELVGLTEAMREAIGHRGSRAELTRLAARGGTRPMAADGWAKVESGITTVEEVLRVVQQ
jgi:type II secretory ATPase GspE/PulE/Tfp pilus assembly ATPase PilB-like protein